MAHSSGSSERSMKSISLRIRRSWVSQKRLAWRCQPCRACLSHPSVPARSCSVSRCKTSVCFFQSSHHAGTCQSHASLRVPAQHGSTGSACTSTSHQKMQGHTHRNCLCTFLRSAEALNTPVIPSAVQHPQGLAADKICQSASLLPTTTGHLSPTSTGHSS